MALVAAGVSSFFFFLSWPTGYPRPRFRLSHFCSSTPNTNNDASKPSYSAGFKLKALDTDSGWSLQQKQSGGAGRTTTSTTTRRELLLQGVFAAVSCSLTAPAPNSVAFAKDNDAPPQDDFRVYLDDVNKFQILIPRDWQVGSGEGDGIRSLTAFYPQEPSKSNVSIVITGLGADFTRLESFGKVDAFAENLVSGLDRSWQRPPGVAAKLVDSRAANGLYYIEYTLQNPGESRRHLFSVLGIANNGWYNRLYTLTGQFVEEEAEKYGSTIEKAVASFTLI